MERVFGIHAIELRPGVSAEGFERFLREEWRPAEIPGVRMYVIKGDRGVHAGDYALVLECESAALRDRYWPTDDGSASAEWQRVRARALETPEQRRIQERLAALTTAVARARDASWDGVPGPEYTDWVVVAG